MNSAPEQSAPERPPRAEVLYRKWRPTRFADVAGQEPVTTTLRNAVAAGAPSHAYLFSGPRGTGKTSTGRILARAVNCTSPQDGEPDDECPSCLSFLRGEALDLIELDAASNRGIDEIRDLREAAGYAPNAARYKVYLIDEVHMLTEPAFNALLKTLEEPPPHVLFVLATTEPRKLPPTILSRCQRFDFARIPMAATIERLRAVASGEGIEAPDDCLDLIARESTGSLRDAINLLDQMVAYHGRELTLEAVRAGLGLLMDERALALARAAVARDLGAGLEVLASVRDGGLEMRGFVRETVSVLRNLLMAKAGGGEGLALADAEAAELKALAAEAATGDVVAALRALGAVDFRGDAYDSLPVEIAFASLAVGLTDAAPGGAPEEGEQGRTAAAPQRPPAQRSSGQQQVREDAPQPRARRQQRPRGQRPDQQPPRSEPAAPAAPAQREEQGGGRQAVRFVPPDGEEVPAALAELRGKWNAVRDAARKRHHRAGALLNTPCAVKSVSDERVEIGFRYPIHVEQVQTLEDGAVMDVIREAVSEALGHPVEVVPVLWEEMQQAAASASTPAPAQSAGSHLVEEALRLGAERAEE